VNLQGRSEYAPYLTAAYGEALSVGQPMRVSMVQSLTPEQLETAYGRTTPPVAIVPPALEPTPVLRNESVLAEIERTGVLKVAFPKDLPPFGFINEENEWDGYCGAIALALGQYLSTRLDVARPVQVVELTSTLQTRFDLARDGTVHLECGPNTIRADIPGITFSEPLYATGARFLIPNQSAETIRPSLPLAGLRLGVLQDSTAASFVRETYPQADIVTFSGNQDQAQAVRAVAAGDIDAFVGDSILSMAEAERQNLSPTDFVLVPEMPLTCEYYGFILPNDDPAWRTLVNAFIQEAEIFQTTFEQDLRDLEACLDQ
jgi:ABC-type amino acid transport substrate-binding protein